MFQRSDSECSLFLKPCCVGGWAGPAIGFLTPFWSTDVAGHFLESKCKKIVAIDHADSIIADASSLKTGISIWKEIRREASTRGIAWKLEAPLEYRMADWESVGVRGMHSIDC